MNYSSEVQKESDEPKTDKNWTILLAGGLGALISGAGDNIGNKFTSVSASLARTDWFIFGELEAILIIGLLGVVVCWVQRPLSRADAFARGLAVLAIVGMASSNYKNLEPEEEDMNILEQSNGLIRINNGLQLASVSSNEKYYQGGNIRENCPEHEIQQFTPNALIVKNKWVSSVEPYSPWYSSKIFVKKCGNKLASGQPIQIISYYETTLSGYYYVKVVYLNDDNVYRSGWVYSGRQPNYFQSIEPLDSHFDPHLGG